MPLLSRKFRHIDGVVHGDVDAESLYEAEHSTRTGGDYETAAGEIFAQSTMIFDVHDAYVLIDG
jgi:hypothetical protein